MPFWDHPHARVHAPLHEIVVRAEHIDGDEPRYVTMDVQEFVICMIQDARYPREAVPHDAVVSAAVDFYICTVENGGHTAFVGNGCWDEALRDDIEEGLHRLGFQALAEIFSELEDFSYNDPERFEAIHWKDPTIHDLDDRFHALDQQKHFERHADWIRSWPNLHIVPSAQHRKVMEALAERNRKKRRWRWR
jgi:hypothetical protein